MIECLECGYTGNASEFKEGCPKCGNWDSWRTKDAPQQEAKNE